ncbi:HK97 family phage prohead protease [Planotetraspora sp. A-T 1434]|uniref:HK97 family phage prohead protease n=1 Tax=Planotetraspora sp. A-T 1434 TaxID=2979219 RepID=UPI0021C1BE27|nr:HK97 family phage prohead protease [Planotetraspora sp. A-T 1434]MCT9932439.1 HK97 family phage prohead protease [Planotetraspora sp. A-T 1434]
MTAVREGLLRSVPFQIVRAVGVAEGDGLTLEGYAAVFGQPTRIDSWEGTFDESIRKGAFRKSIRERTPVLQFDHGRHPLVGSIPIGKIQDLREDDQGLYVSARLSDNWLVEPVRDAIRDEAVDGMSFRFTVVREEWRDKDGKLVKPEDLGRLLWDPGDRGPLQRELIEIRCAELGPVVWPAYEGTSVGVRAREVASLISRDRGLQREVRSGLARDAGAVPEAEADDLADPETRREVARALLFGDTKTSDAPPLGHPSADETRSEGAPPTGHPPKDTDAPPLDGHPSATTTSNDRLRSQIREIAGLMAERLATIEEK